MEHDALQLIGILPVKENAFPILFSKKHFHNGSIISVLLP